MKVAVVVDSGSNYFNEHISKQDLFAIPLVIVDGDKPYQESVELSVEEANKKMQEGTLLKTSLPALGEIVELFTQIKERGYDLIFALPITSGLSGTISAMEQASQMVDIPFAYLDTYSTAHINLYAAYKALEMFREGSTLEEVKETLKHNIDKSNTIVIPDNLDHLARGGRLSPVAAKLGGLLKIKPVLELNPGTKGIIEPKDKVRTMNKAIDSVIESMKEAGVDDTYFITIADCDNKELREATIAKLKEAFPNTTIEPIDLMSTIAVHCGVGSVALQYMPKYK